MIEFGYAMRRLDKVRRTTEQLITRLHDLNEANSKLREQNSQLKDQIKLRARWDKENLPDDQQVFIKEFMNKYDTQDKASQ